MHYAVSNNTAAEIVYNGVDSKKDNIGLTNFKGDMPTRKETEIAKNHLSYEELQILNRLMSAYLDIAEINALKRKAMTMQDWIHELDSFLKMTHNDISQTKGSVSQLIQSIMIIESNDGLNEYCYDLITRLIDISFE